MGVFNDIWSISWSCRTTWRQSSINTLWCLLGCSIGDFGTILFFQISEIPLPAPVSDIPYKTFCGT